MTTKPNPTNYVTTDESSDIKRVNEDNSTTPIVEVTPVEIAPDQEIETIDENNQEDELTAVETWLEIDENVKSVSYVIDCTDNTEATVEYTLDRSASPAHAITADIGTISNDKESGYFAGAIAQIRMNITTDNAVAEVKSSLSTDLVGNNNDIVYTSKLTGTAGDAITVAYIDPSENSQSLLVEVTGTDITVNLATDGGGLITSTADEIKAAIAALPAAHALVGTADKAGNDGSGVVTAMVKTALSGGVNAVAATLPKLWVIGVK